MESGVKEICGWVMPRLNFSGWLLIQTLGPFRNAQYVWLLPSVVRQLVEVRPIQLGPPLIHLPQFAGARATYQVCFSITGGFRVHISLTDCC